MNEVIEECLEMTLYETFVEEQINKGKSIIGLYPATDPEIQKSYQEWKKSLDR
ncbi:MAG: hypothetical protein KJO41_01780 [Bacteroidia bacterium]|nr:hypothetical protein [Bacteroidia bacterium]MBT8277702.1 hypothetical protein [Bacteroidia bacterium]NND25947.1 hypothetical protein [Flavobacteriaceae bacterium]NNK59222.1 hypothetical protein [Flavobacteriaceae bacterium]NNL32332.1 hypothetical protein [Flavobacteriaceae bacterium]